MSPLLPALKQRPKFPGRVESVKKVQGRHSHLRIRYLLHRPARAARCWGVVVCYMVFDACHIILTRALQVAPLLPALRHREEGPRGILVRHRHLQHRKTRAAMCWVVVVCHIMFDTCHIIFDTCIAGGTAAASSRTASTISGTSGKGQEVSVLRNLPLRIGTNLPPLTDRLRITARQAALRNLGKQAVQQLCEQLGVFPIPNNFTCMIKAATDAEELLLKAAEEREGQEGAAGNACCVIGICWYVTLHIRSGRHELCI